MGRHDAGGVPPRREGGTGVLFDIGPHVVDYLGVDVRELQPVMAYPDDALAGIESNLSMEVEITPAAGRFICPGTTRR